MIIVTLVTKTSKIITITICCSLCFYFNGEGQVCADGPADTTNSFGKRISGVCAARKKTSCFSGVCWAERQQQQPTCFDARNPHTNPHAEILIKLRIIFLFQLNLIWNSRETITTGCRKHAACLQAEGFGVCETAQGPLAAFRGFLLNWNSNCS